MNAKLKENDYICGTCRWFDSGIHDCEIHLEYGFRLEEDTCDDWTDPAEPEPTDEEKRANAGCDEAHRIMVEGREIG